MLTYFLFIIKEYKDSIVAAVGTVFVDLCSLYFQCRDMTLPELLRLGKDIMEEKSGRQVCTALQNPETELAEADAELTEAQVVYTCIILHHVLTIMQQLISYNRSWQNNAAKPLIMK